MPDTGYQLVEPFETDNGKLDGIAPGECFALGVEWEMFRQELHRRSTPFTKLVMANNAKRFSDMAQRQGRFVEHNPSEAPGWAEIRVGSKTR